MKVYTLINEYPGMPNWLKRGTTVIGEKGSNFLYPVNTEGDWRDSIQLSYVQGFPHVWVPCSLASPYTVLQMIDKHKVIRTLSEEGNYQNEGGDDVYTLPFALKEGSIYSVERSKDHQVFTVGDRVMSGSKAYIIDGFTLTVNAVVEIICQSVNDPYKKALYLGDLTPSKKVIGTSYDKQPIHVGDPIFHVRQDTLTVRSTTVGPFTNVDALVADGVYLFKSELTAKQWVEDNTPVFTYAEIEKLIPTYFGTLKEFRALARKKLNK